jgi:calcineurin-like phosphoesterase family protein
MSVFFTSDTHFGHANIIKYCNRPYKTVDEMDEDLIRSWNSVVGKHDTVYHLGDFSMKPADYYISRLNGHIHLIIGNHEKEALKVRGRFASVHDLHSIKHGEQGIILCHYAMRVWNKSHHGYWHLYGHSHGTLPDDPNSKSLDVGVDCWNFAPVSMEQLTQAMSRKNHVPVDHHGEETLKQESGRL